MHVNSSLYAFSARSPLRGRRGFSLAELLVVIGIIALLIALLLPTLTKAREQAQKVQCMSNMRQVYMQMMSYAGENNGYMFPTDKGWPGTTTPPAIVPGTTDQYDVWPYYVFNRIWNPPVMLCPSDLESNGQHSYIVNSHVPEWNVKFGNTLPNGIPASSVIVMGEKVTLRYDYYMEPFSNTSQPDEFDTVVAPYRHGTRLGSNYLMLDGHVESQLPAAAQGALDPWGFAGGTPPAGGTAQ